MSSGAWAGAAMAGVTAAYALCSRWLSSTPLSSAIVFVGAGILIGPAVLDIVDLERDTAPIIALLEATLTLVLFTDAMTIRRRDLRTGGFLPGRLLGIGLPLSIGAGWLLAWPLPPGLTVWELALVGAILAPTDAALGKTAISHPRVPALVRHGPGVPKPCLSCLRPTTSATRSQAIGFRDARCPGRSRSGGSLRRLSVSATGSS
ncbi:hypothetical protein [Streptomyces sp. NBC_00005]|uniref:hypothetical protein n=1 Tax=Streptomyces sp. NBC_00005 TaxID=2903609 RepID=UPI00324F21BE